MSYSMLKHYLE